MDQTYLLHWMLMSVLLITVYGNNTDVNITCPDQTGTVGELLTLTCNVTCKSYVYKDHLFRHNGKLLSDKMEPVDGNRTYYYTIANPTLNDSGVYTLWIQMTHGCNSTNFTVTIGLKEEAQKAPPSLKWRIAHREGLERSEALCGGLERSDALGEDQSLSNALSGDLGWSDVLSGDRRQRHAPSGDQGLSQSFVIIELRAPEKLIK
ncbi:hypothetical protein C0J50_1739 [Silurus asotus]|uniref:Immunoglobulin domain-containing protein n=1 Tax=Silurus asotus TaxID=30991 RepID=A0AAD5A0C0_SILAS|nr:hypothetical protein C0J50_1739 [Silurus asotus]